MVAIARIPFDLPVSRVWPVLVDEVLGWAAREGVALRDAVMLVPAAAHLPLARAAWRARGGWMPRIDTARTLAAALGPPPRPEPDGLTFDAALDALTARRLLRSQSRATDWLRRDPRGFEQGVAMLVEAAHALARGASAVPPDERAAHWAGCRSAFSAPAGPGASERWLLRIALEWAAASGPAATDALFALQPSAWIVPVAAGIDPLAARLARSHGTPLVIDLDADPQHPFDVLPATCDVRRRACADAEDEAQQAAAQVLAQLADGAPPVALVALDRMLVRRVRALLARHRVPVHDETGWRLSTTRAGARVAALLRAASDAATRDDWLDWLKGAADALPLPGSAGALDALEQQWRRHPGVRPQPPEADLGAALRIWQAADALLAPLRVPAHRSLAAWLAALRSALQACGSWAALESDDAGRQVLSALHLRAQPPAADELLPAPAFGRWVDAVLEQASFLPDAPRDVQVVITPLVQAGLRPFCAIVVPGADAAHLGGATPSTGLLPESLAAPCHVPDAAARRLRETLAFAQLLRSPRVLLLHRRDADGETVAPSTLLQRLALARQRGGHALPEASEARSIVAVPAAPVAPPQPVASHRLPKALTASSADALRACPYRFFALRMLGLQPEEELDDAVEKREYGIWLHRVLHRFHRERAAAPGAMPDLARLQAAAARELADAGFDGPAFLPFSATFERLAPHYLEWLAQHESEGARWQDGEVALAAAPAEWEGTAMQGRIDRIDSLAAGGVQLYDYKTGRADKLNKQVRQPGEDTQLVFYAALLAGQQGAPAALEAAYLPLDASGDAIKPIVHAEVLQAVGQLVEGLGHDLRRIRVGAALPALGEGADCEHCDARGLCRRDHWAAAP